MNKTRAILIRNNSIIQPIEVQLSSSKSESNRALVINALAGFNSTLENLSNARDTATMRKLLEHSERELNVLDAGTTMRFLTAYCAVNTSQRIIFGTDRMNERPIRILVDALKEIGSDIRYLKAEGYPPLEIHGLQRQQSSYIRMRGDVSSQYISAVMMVAPTLPLGLTIELTGAVNSRPYIEMTLALMENFGVRAVRKADNIFHFDSQPYRPVTYRIESDWSGASYWYSIVSLCKEGVIRLPGLKKESLQGDRVIADIMEEIGVKTRFTANGALLEKTHAAGRQLTIDFSDCPDLAQTIAVVCAAKGIVCRMSGIESLRIKETDRILALQNELAKIGASLEEEAPRIWKLTPGNGKNIPSPLTIKTYDDHRMAMAFAPLAIFTDLIVENSDVVQKSYPGFWTELKKAGFAIEEA